MGLLSETASVSATVSTSGLRENVSAEIGSGVVELVGDVPGGRQITFGNTNLASDAMLAWRPGESVSPAIQLDQTLHVGRA